MTLKWLYLQCGRESRQVPELQSHLGPDLRPEVLGQDGELFVSGGDGAAASQPSDAALDDVTPAMEIRIEEARAALAHLATLAGRDHRPDPASPEVGEDWSGAVDLLAGEMFGDRCGGVLPRPAGAGPTRSARSRSMRAAAPGRGGWHRQAGPHQEDLGAEAATREAEGAALRPLRVPLLRAPMAERGWPARRRRRCTRGPGRRAPPCSAQTAAVPEARRTVLCTATG